MPVLRYENLTHLELSALNRERTVVFLAVGPLEQHGPHLPLGTDAITAAYFADTMAERLAQKRPDWNILIFPTVFAGSDTLTYTGSIEVRPALLRAFLLANCVQLARDGFRTIVAFNAHGGPRHVVVLEEISARMKWRYRTRMISASSRVLSNYLDGTFAEKIADRLSKTPNPMTAEEREGLKGDFHGGMVETSIMLAARPQMVNPMYKTLRPALVSSFWKLRRSSGKKVGEGLGHLGSPALARPEIGTAAIETLVDEVAPGIERFLDGANVDREFRSKFYRIPLFRTDLGYLLLLLSYPAIITVLWYVMGRAAIGLMR